MPNPIATFTARCTPAAHSHARGLAGLVVVLSTGALAAPPVVHNLGVMPGGTYSFNGVVSGDGNSVTGHGDTTVSSGNPVRPFRWVFPGPMQVVPLTVASHGRGISHNGQHVVGFNQVINTPFRWTVASGFTPMNLLPGGTTAFVNGTSSNSSASAGHGSTATPGSSRAIRWNSAGWAQDLGILPGATIINGVPSSFAFGISADGSTVVGLADWASGFSHAFRWNVPFGPMVSLGTLPGGYDCRAVAISADNSTIVGHGDTTGSSGNRRAWRLKAPVPMQNLGIIAGSGAYVDIRTFAVSRNGSRVVGTSYDNIFGNRAWIRMGATGMLDLRAYVASLGGIVTGWVLVEARGISSDGTAISGWGEFNGQARAFLIKGLPCLDPTSGWFPDTAPPVGICADPNWPVGSGPGLPSASVSITADTDGSEPLEHIWQVSIGGSVGTPPQAITGPIFEDPVTGVSFSVEGWTGPTITISNLRPAPQYPNIGVGVIVTNPCGSVATTFRELQISAVCAPPACGPSDIAGPGLATSPDGELTADDIIVFVSWFTAGNLGGDVAGPGPSVGGDGEFTADDVILFINLFTAGC